MFNTYLPKVEKVEGLSPDDFLKKALGIDKELQAGEKNDDMERHRKETMKLIYSAERFIMNKIYHTDNQETLTDFTKLVEFVKSSINGEVKYYWDS